MLLLLMYNVYILSILVYLFIYLLYVIPFVTDCAPRQYSYDSVVCVCNATYCDNPGPIASPAANTQFTSVTSSREGQRFQVATADKGAAPTVGKLVSYRIGEDSSSYISPPNFSHF